MANVDKRLFTKFWIRPELRVYHIDRLKGTPRVHYVEYLIKKGVPVSGSDKRKSLVVGVMCHWFVEVDGVETQQRGRFGRNEIVPADVFDAGTEVLMRWSETQSNF